MPNLGTGEIIAILLVIVLLFGARKLPEAARGLGRSLRIFKAEIKDPNDEEGRDRMIEPGATASQQQPVITAGQVAPGTPVVPVQPAPPVQQFQPVQPVQPTYVPSGDVAGPPPVQQQQPVQQGEQSPTDR